ncbi:hypothetical protein BDQ17DRAFT_1368705 [Cyathus striatus]|nr:hypothetical protein BDQ17DRAFT_1368705 [Cyathus striatus]
MYHAFGVVGIVMGFLSSPLWLVSLIVMGRFDNPLVGIGIHQILSPSSNRVFKSIPGRRTPCKYQVPEQSQFAWKVVCMLLMAWYGRVKAYYGPWGVLI